ncbi:MAG: acetyl CoA synthetase subunit alpha [Acidobacteria bacterium]|nr:MAG: acetyl CoA synthetase subunit alpha [Acidobacteriota bacterium]
MLNVSEAKPSKPPRPPSEPASDVLHHREHPLGFFFAPNAVAVIGASASPNSVGRTLLYNLVSHPFGGTVFPVNSKRSEVLGIKAYPSIAEVPEKVDLAVIATPAATVPGVVDECVQAGVRGAIIISAGFKEAGPAGAELERQVFEKASRGKMRIIGPNCLGLMNPITGLNATFASAIAKPGTVGFISQSGALCTAILDWSFREHVGFSAFISIGSMADVGWGDLVDYLGDDPNTRSIIIYMESVGDARSFLSAAREVAFTKPIIMLKAGRTAAATKAAASHTGALTGNDDVLDAAFRRSGVLRVEHMAELFHMAEVLAKQPRPRGPRLAIVTNAGGPGVLAADALLTHGGELAPLAPETMSALNAILPPHWSHNNPVDILGDSDADRYAKAVEVLAKDPTSDGLLVILTPQAMTDPTGTAELVKRFAKLEAKPLLASWMGGEQAAPGFSILTGSGIPTFPFPDSAARTFDYMWKYSYNLRGLYETPSLAASPPDQPLAQKIIREARKAGRKLLTEVESKQVLAAYGIPTVATRLAHTAEEAARVAGEIGFPVAVKLHSQTITHKTEVGGVCLNLEDAAGVARAFEEIRASVVEAAGAEHFLGVTVQAMAKAEGLELILGSSVDSQFGPVLMFGAGGQLVEILKDRALALPPLNTTLARRMMEQTRIYKAFEGFRGRTRVDVDALEQLLVRFSQLVVEERWVKEIDVNPLLASSEGLVALDARLVLHEPGTRVADLPRLAIRPYPANYTFPAQTRDGLALTLRPIRPEDEPWMVKFHEGLSEQSVYLRYFHALGLSQRIAHERLTRICFIDYDRQMALVAERAGPDTQGREILAVGRLSKTPAENEAEISLLVSDRYQRRGIGAEMLRRLIEVGRAEKLARIRAEILPENHITQKVLSRQGFKLTHSIKDGVVRGVLTL